MLGFIGGTGPEGRGLALRFALAGERVMIGSRQEERALQAAESLWSLIDPARVRWGVNRETAQESDIVFVAVPYSGHRDTLESLAAELSGKIVVDVVAPLAVRREAAPRPYRSRRVPQPCRPRPSFPTRGSWRRSRPSAPRSCWSRTGP